MVTSTATHEILLIEAYALGYVAAKIDKFSPLREMSTGGCATADNCFNDLMKRNSLDPIKDRTYAFSYKIGYRDSLLGQRSKVRIKKQKGIFHKIWRLPTNIALWLTNQFMD